MNIVNAFECGYCKKLFLDIEKCIVHERTCKKNPEGLSCKDCDHYRYRTVANPLFKDGQHIPYCEKGKKTNRRTFLACEFRSFTL